MLNTGLVPGAIATLLAIATLSVLAGCGARNEPDDGDGAGEGGTAAAASANEGYGFPVAPEVPAGALAPKVDSAIDRLLSSATTATLDADALETVAGSDDPRLGWLLSDMLRFIQGGEPQARLVEAFERLSSTDLDRDPDFADSPWLSVTNHMIAWDLPAPPAYRERKAGLFLPIEPGWKPFFADRSSAIDWRLISWGGVRIDDRPPGDLLPCVRGCIPALDDPPLTPADAGDWYPDERPVFGLVVGGEAVAFPKNIMEVHEMVNITVGEKRLGIPYCTLCGSAQAYLLESVPSGVRTPVLRTSGLLSRSNKVMYDLRSRSVLDTFTGRALSGPLRERGVELEQTSVIASSWGAWKRAHPETRILAEDGGLGRSYPLDPLGGRDDAGPIFPVGDVDPRLPVQAQIVGVIAPGGEPLAFPAEEARAALEDGRRVGLGGVELALDGDGLIARSEGGDPLAAHQAFWFAWSQFHPETGLWRPAGE